MTPKKNDLKKQDLKKGPPETCFACNGMIAPTPKAAETCACQEKKEKAKRM